MISNTELERERSFAAEKLERDNRWFLRIATEAIEKYRSEGFKKAYEEGFRQGYKEGFKLGFKEGLAGRFLLCEQILKRPLTSRENLLELSIEVLEAETLALEKRVLERP